MVRKKTDKSSRRSTSSESTSNEQKLPSNMKESLERATIAVERGQQQMLTLHNAWRSQLQRISFLVLMIVLKQASIPASVCMEKINERNGGMVTTDSSGDGSDDSNSIFISKWESVKYCISDSYMEISSVLCCLSFIWLLFQPLQGNDFSSRPFRLVVFFVPLIVASYYSNPTVGCLRGIDGDDTGSIENDGVASGKPRSFPVVLILLVVGFVSLYIMKNQQQEQLKNIQKVEKLREELLSMNGEKKKK